MTSTGATTEPAAAATPRPAGRPGRLLKRSRTALAAHGEPMVWLMGGALVLALFMIAGLLALVLYQGLATFWPQPLEAYTLANGEIVMGEVSEVEERVPGEFALNGLDAETVARAEQELAENDGFATRMLVRTGNFDVTGEHFEWVDEFTVNSVERPEWALLIERLSWGRFYGTPAVFRIDGEVVADEPAAVWEEFQRQHPGSRERFAQRQDLEVHAIGRVNRRLESARLKLRSVELANGIDSDAWRTEQGLFQAVSEEVDLEFRAIQEKIAVLREENERYELVMETAGGDRKALVPAAVVRGYPANQLSLGEKFSIYLSRWKEFLIEDPREANSEGGVFPAIFGTVIMTLVMSVVVVPFGVLAALYLREYAKQGAIVSAVRIAVNNLAGVPSIVFGVFGLGFFCYIIGGGLDQVFFEARLPSPTFGTGGLFWASLTLALLTLPVVIVATEEALAAVPNSMREGSYACGATKWQTIRRIVLPRAAPGIMTGTILAIARGAGEVAPLMLVGAVKLAPELPVDGVFPFVHPERSFMHLGYHIFDLGFQSQNSEAAKPMVYTTTLLLISIIIALNLLAIWVRARLRRRFHGHQV